MVSCMESYSTGQVCTPTSIFNLPSLFSFPTFQVSCSLAVFNLKGQIIFGLTFQYQFCIFTSPKKQPMKRINYNFVFFAAFFFLLIPNLLTAQYYDEPVGETWYDLQSNAATQNRIYLYEDGTIGVVWTMGFTAPGFFDRGTGYNYFDGNSWDSIPTERIESDRTGWPSYAPLGENGEITIAHYSSADTVGLVYCRRPNNGVGNWEETIFSGPQGHEGLLWPRMVTGGENNMHIYLIAITRPIGNGGSLYEGMDGSLLYSRSTDGGMSWDIQNTILPGMDSSWYKSLNGDAYAWAEPKEDVVAFVAGSYNHDLFLMKSSDYGETFEKTLIWDHPFDHGNPVIPLDTFYCPDGSVSIALDMQSTAHVAFGISKMYFDIDSTYERFIDVDGVGYWNENMDLFSSDYNALNPYNHPDSELEKDITLIAWCQDINGDSTFNILGEWGYYNYRGMSSMPQIVIDEQNRIFVAYCSVTETYDNGLMDYRRLWIRSSLNVGQSWGPFYHYGGDDPSTIYDEYAFPSLASYSDGYLYLIYMKDNEPGLHQAQGGGPYGINYINFSKIPKDEVVGIEEKNLNEESFAVSQNFPNPFTNETLIEVYLENPSPILLEVINLTGQKVYSKKIEKAAKGKNQLVLSSEGLSSGIYFYTVKVGGSSISKKLIIK